MAAPRKYTDAQRAEIYRLHEAGLTSEQISAACARGSAGTDPFAIPRRSVSAIVAKMEEEARVRLPTAPDDIGGLEGVRRFPERISRIVDAEIDRLAKKQLRGTLTTKDIEVLRKAAEISGPLTKRLQGQSSPIANGRANTRNGRANGAPRESVIEKMARERNEERVRAYKLSSTRARREPPEGDAKPVDTLPANGAPEQQSVPTASELQAARIAARRRASDSPADQALMGGGSGSPSSSGVA